jgi:hypothetical protein
MAETAKTNGTPATETVTAAATAMVAAEAEVRRRVRRGLASYRDAE